MKKFLSLVLAAMLLLSCACAEVVPSIGTDVGVGDAPADIPAVEGALAGAVATPGIFVRDESEAAVNAAQTVLDAVAAAPTPVEAYKPETKEAVVTVLAQTGVVEAMMQEGVLTSGEELKDKIVLAAAPIALNVNEIVAKDIIASAGAEPVQDEKVEAPVAAQILTINNVTVNKHFVVILTLTTAGVVEEIVLADTASNADANEVYVAVNNEVIAKIHAADTAVVTILTVAQ